MSELTEFKRWKRSENLIERLYPELATLKVPWFPIGINEQPKTKLENAMNDWQNYIKKNGPIV